MTVSRSALVLFFGVLASGHAQAGKGTTKHMLGHDIMAMSQYYRVIVDNDATDEVASVELRVSSDAGSEDLVLTESDAWLHGSAALSSLPVEDAALAVTLYDKGSASLMTFAGTLATDGTVTLAGGCDVQSRLGCTSYDVEVLAAEVYPSGKGYLLTLDLAGADTYAVAFATVVVTGGEETEVDWDAEGSVWTADPTLDHTGVIDVKASVLDSEGEPLENVKSELAAPWGDDSEGVSALSAGSRTSVAVRGYGAGKYGLELDTLVVVSSGWSATSYPTHAELELAGDTVTVPANAFQRHAPTSYPVCGGYVNSGEKDYRNAFGDTSFSITSGSFVLEDRSVAEMLRPQCSAGTCVMLVEGDKGYELAVTTYAADPGKLPDKQAFGLVLHDSKGTEVWSEAVSVTYTADLGAVFASQLEIEGDPIGGDASGSVSLLGAATKGRQATLSKATFYGSFSRDSDGDLALGGYGADDRATCDASADAVLGDPVEADDEGPPAIQFAVGGKVTKIVVSSGGLDY